MINIFHPTEFSLASQTAFKHALRLALSVRGRLTIMHVQSDSTRDADWSRFPHVREMLSHWGVVANDINPSDLMAKTGLEVQKIEAVGNPADAIGDYLGRHPPDLMVLATHGRTGLAAMVEPSVSRALVRASCVPVLFVREGIPGFVLASGRVSLDTVLVPVDRNPDPQPAIDWVSRLEEWTQIRIGSVLALHVGDGPLVPQVRPPHLSGGTFANLDRDGEPLASIIEAAERHQADLVVMSAAGPDSLRERFLGSTTERMVLHAPCPVLVVRERTCEE